MAQSPGPLAEDSGIVKSNTTSTESLLKQQSELSSKWEGAVAQYKAEIAALQSKNEELSELVQKQKSELDGLRHKDEAKAEQLKHIEEMTVGVPENMNKMTLDEIKDRFRTVHQWSTPGYLPPPEPETSVTPPKKHISTSSGSKTAAGKRERRPSGPETSEQKGVTLRRSTIPSNKTTSVSRKK